jgi:hypothetical protein
MMYRWPCPRFYLKNGFWETSKLGQTAGERKDHCFQSGRFPAPGYAVPEGIVNFKACRASV